MRRLIASLVIAISLSGCALLPGGGNTPPPPPPPIDVPVPPVDPPPPTTGPSTWIVPAQLSGQFVIKTYNPFSQNYPGAKPDRFFMSELDSVWSHYGQGEAQRILDDYKRLGHNHIMLSTIVDRAYSNLGPNADWRGNAEGYADFLWWLRDNGVVFTVVVVPDILPYYTGGDRRQEFNMDALWNDIHPVLSHPRVQVATLKTATMWESWAPIPEMAKVFQFQFQLFPNAERVWHNGIGHLSPCNGDEHEADCWRSAIANGITGMALQVFPLNIELPVHGDEKPRTHLNQARYDAWDMARRFWLTDDDGPEGQGAGRPWGPMFRPDGSLLTLDLMEAMAYCQYWTEDCDANVGRHWRFTLQNVTGIRWMLDADK